MSIASYLSEELGASVDFTSFLDAFREKLRKVFHQRADANNVSTRRGLPPFMMREIQSLTPLSVFIPKEYGGRGGHVHECQAVLAAASYESLALSLTLGINGALFLQPFTKYGHDAIKGPVFKRFIEDKNMGGLMITEPDYGTDALNMQTSYTEKEDGYHVQGTKHWAGLTGWADFWLITARRSDGNGNLGRDIDFFVADSNRPDQMIEVEEVYQNLGLYMIPYRVSGHGHGFHPPNARRGHLALPRTIRRRQGPDRLRPGPAPHRRHPGLLHGLLGHVPAHERTRRPRQ